MNQQRSRRFKAAQEMAEEEQVEEEMRGILRSKGHNLPPKKKSTFDHNVITPGTEFMDRLSRHLAYHVVKRQAGDAGWRGLKVILSDASVPGEGEHKIMEFVRQQRSQPGYNPNVSHCLHGLDADLIMLGLATHEPRERPRSRVINPCARNASPLLLQTLRSYARTFSESPLVEAHVCV